MWVTVERFMARAETNEPRVRINRGSEVVVTIAALRLMGEPAQVRLVVDRERRLLGLEPALADDPEAFRLTGKGAIRRFSTVALSRTFGLDSRRQAFTPRWDGERLEFGPYAVAVGPAGPPVSAVRQMVQQANGPRQTAGVR